MRSVAEFMANNWLLFVVPIAFISLGVTVLKLFISDKKSEAWTTLIIGMLVVILGPQVWVLIADTFEDAPLCPEASPITIQTCRIGQTWSAWQPATTGTPAGMVLCVEVVSGAGRWAQSTTRSEAGPMVAVYRFKSTSRDEVVLRYKLYWLREGNICPAPLNK